MDGSDDSDDDEELDTREPAFMVSHMSAMYYSFHCYVKTPRLLHVSCVLCTLNCVYLFFCTHALQIASTNLSSRPILSFDES